MNFGKLDKGSRYTLKDLSLAQMLMINDEICERYPNTYQKSHTTKFFNGQHSQQAKSLNYNHSGGYWNVTIAEAKNSKPMKHFFAVEAKTFKNSQFIVL